MRETRLLIGYALAVASAVSFLAYATQYSMVEAARYLPDSEPKMAASSGSAELASASPTRDANTQPVWIAPTPKYQYDPKLMEVKPRHELMKEAELRRAKELASLQAKRREARARQNRQARESYAYAPEQQRPDFLLFPFVR
jgi:hypothetical protein